MVGGTTRSPLLSRAIATISSTKSAFPPDAAVMRSRAPTASSCSPSRLSISDCALVVPERLEQERGRVELAAAPVRSSVEKLGPRDAEEEDRRVAREVGDVLDEVDELGLGPLQVVDHGDLRPIDCALLEQLPERDSRLGRSRRDDALRLDPERYEHLDERPVRDALAVRETAATEDVGRVAHAFEEVGDEARLADARWAEQREELAGPIGDGILERAPEPLPLPLAADERHCEVALDRRGSVDDGDEPVSLDGRDFPFSSSGSSGSRGRRRGRARASRRR